MAGQVRLRYGHAADQIDLRPDGRAQREDVRLRLGVGGLWMDRPQENHSSLHSDRVPLDRHFAPKMRISPPNETMKSTSPCGFVRFTWERTAAFG